MSVSAPSLRSPRARSPSARGIVEPSSLDENAIEALCAWFDRHARALPWRRRRSGYSALVSEAMLQQTQVSRVIDRYLRFMRRFPTLAALAEASLDDVLSEWQGLGYYRRAKNLHAAAGIIVREHRGRVPRDVAALRRLPGVGRYTAGAIASIVFSQYEPIVDGNVERVLQRLLVPRELRRGGRACDARSWAWQAAELSVTKARRPGVFNEALMELGATVCVPAPAQPRCTECPLASACAARHLGLQNVIPRAKARPTPRVEHHHAIVIRGRDGRILVERRSESGMWAGLWQTPTIESGQRLTIDEVATRLGVSVQSGLREVASFDHRTTHRAITFHVIAATASPNNRRRDTNAQRPSATRWVTLEQSQLIGMSNAQKRVLACSGESGGLSAVAFTSPPEVESTVARRRRSARASTDQEREKSRRKAAQRSGE